MLYRSSVYLLGMVINFLGVTLIINATLGAGFWTAFFIGVSDILGLTVGIWYGVFQFIIIFINAKLMKQRPEIRAIIPLVLESIILDFWLEVVFANIDLSTIPFVFQVTTLLAGVAIVGLGVAIYILPQFPRAPVDQLFLAISHRFNLSLQLGQTLVAVMMTSLAFVIGGPVGLGTLAPMLFLGPMIQLWYTRAYPLYYKFYNQREQVLQEKTM
ncbi:YczE/YyaS/YitT family protein [Halobacillus seohaensis]|uniref:YitT family protein n=1 Tax=Halobacillus seohaensis TaxID=447421 RepID=A0ABW2EM12_9BACI